MNYMLFGTALALSSVAEYYSIMGLIAIFSGAVTSIAIMGIVLGIAKLVLTSWLYRNWKETPRLLKLYFIVAIFILMSLTSMGIFGYLSKAHLEQGIVSGDVAAEVELLDEKINIHKENINAARKTIVQLDSQVEAVLSRSTDTAGADKSSSIRRSQAKERARILDDITASQREISRLTEERAPRAIELRKVEAEVGPIKYIAALIYEDSNSKDTLEKAVRGIILLIVTVFDPLAVLMFVAYNQSVSRLQNKTPIDLYDRKSNDSIPEKNIDVYSIATMDDHMTMKKW
jgi:hypothetical protein